MVLSLFSGGDLEANRCACDRLEMKNTCSAEGLGRDLLSPCGASYFLSISPKVQALTGPDNIPDAPFTCRPHLGFPLKHTRLRSPREALG